jgi:hypothetical protein
MNNSKMIEEKKKSKYNEYCEEMFLKIAPK